MEVQHYQEYLLDILNKRKEAGLYRELKIPGTKVDFFSNDYLGLARNQELADRIDKVYAQVDTDIKLGSTGSRLLSGHNTYFERTEAQLAELHNAEDVLIFNSGYMANMAVFSALPQRSDTVLYDELSHACIKDGARLSPAERFPFRHNNLHDLEMKMQKTRGRIFVGVESVYSMDGDFAPLEDLVKLCNQYKAVLIVDEAHSTGVFGRNGSGLVNELGLEKEVPVRIHTFGKAIGAHGAAVAGSAILKQYLVNFARPFIFTTSMSLHSILTVSEAYRFLSENTHLQSVLKERIKIFNEAFCSFRNRIRSESPVQIILVDGNERAKAAGAQLQSEGFDIRPILSPTVRKGQERLRICLHVFNTEDEIQSLAKAATRLGL